MLSHQLTRARDAFVVARPAAEVAMAAVSPDVSRNNPENRPVQPAADHDGND
jgi:hypothetical protein